MGFLSSLFTDFGAQILSPVTAAFALAAIGVNIQFGYTGLLNIGQAGFMLLGAYGVAITIEFGGPLWLGVLIAIIAAVLFALVLGLPTLKLRGDYLAIVTIAAAEIVRIVGGDQSLVNVTGAVAGIPGTKYQGAFTATVAVPQERPAHHRPVHLPLQRGQQLVADHRGAGSS